MPTATTPIAIDVHTAVKAAIAFFKETFGSTKLENVQLEEVEKSKDGRFWLITVGYDDPNLHRVIPGFRLLPQPTQLLQASQLRRYKVIRVDAKTGEAVSVKIRE